MIKNDLQTLFKRMPPSYQKQLRVGQSDQGYCLQLKQKIESFNELDEFITQLREQLGQFIRGQIEVFKKDKIYYESSFVLSLDKDAITKEAIKNPILLNEFQNLVLDPQFCNQDVFSQFFDASKFNFRNINYFCEQLVLTLKLWEILQFYQSRTIHKKFSILILPNKCNFAVLDQNNQLFFNNSERQKLEFLQLNSVFTQNGQESKQYLEELFSKERFNLFDEFPIADIVDKGKIIDYYYQGEQKTSIVKKKNFNTIHSTLCEGNLTHIITFEKDQYPRCSQCQFVINQDNYDTLYISLQWYNLYERIQDYLLLRASIIEVYFFVNPIQFQFEIKDQLKQLVLIVQKDTQQQIDNNGFEIQQEQNQNKLQLCLNLDGHYEYESQDYQQDGLEKQNNQYNELNTFENEEIASTNQISSDCKSSKIHTVDPQLTRNDIIENKIQPQHQVFGQEMQAYNDYQLNETHLNNNDAKNNSQNYDNQNENELCEQDDSYECIEEYEY